MPARKVCQNFFHHALAPFHQYRQNALIDATTALMNGASLSLTSIGRYLPGNALVKHKIKRIDRLLGNPEIHSSIPSIFNNITSLMTQKLSWCVIAIDWSGYPFNEYYVLRASLVCDGRAIPLMSQIVPVEKQNNVLIQNEFLDSLAQGISADTKVIIITDAGFKSAWFRHIKSLGWDFIGRIRGTVKFCLQKDPKTWLNISDCKGQKCPEYLGPGVLARAKNARNDGHFYLYSKASVGRKNKPSKGRPAYAKAKKEHQVLAKTPWLIFTSITKLAPLEIIKLYSRRMQIEQNFRDEKSERFGLGLRASRSTTRERFWVLSLLSTLAIIALWLVGYHFESKGFHLHYQASSIKKRRVISFLTLATNILRHSPSLLRRMALNTILNSLAKVYRNMVMRY